MIDAKSYPAGVIAVVYGIIEQPALGWTDSIVLASLASGASLVVGFVMDARNSAQRLLVCGPEDVG